MTSTIDNAKRIARDDATLAKLMKTIISGNFENLPALQQTLNEELDALNRAPVELKQERFKDLGILLNGALLGMDWHYETDQQAIERLMDANNTRWQFYLQQKWSYLQQRCAFLSVILNSNTITQESAA